MLDPRILQYCIGIPRTLTRTTVGNLEHECFLPQSIPKVLVIVLGSLPPEKGGLGCNDWGPFYPPTPVPLHEELPRGTPPSKTRMQGLLASQALWEIIACL